MWYDGEARAGSTMRDGYKELQRVNNAVTTTRKASIIALNLLYFYVTD